jgi:hypothetical protein
MDEDLGKEIDWDMGKGCIKAVADAGFEEGGFRRSAQGEILEATPIFA